MTDTGTITDTMITLNRRGDVLFLKDCEVIVYNCGNATNRDSDTELPQR